jgi:hypothetical protein
MEPSSTAQFAHAARVLGREVRQHGLVAPGFRCPPRLVGVDRTLRRRPGGAVIAVRVRGRPWPAVLADMIEGVIVCNALSPPGADRLRADLWHAVSADAGHSAGADPATSPGSHAA